MHWDWTINPSNLIAAAGLILMLFKFQGNIVKELVEIRVKLDLMWIKFVKDTGAGGKEK